MPVRKTPLNEVHHEMGARLVEFAGWEMPVQYSSALQEHLQVRRSVGVFDVSHMGELEIRGPETLSLLQRVTCNDVSRIADGQAQYSAFLTPEGAFVDDIVLYRISSDHVLICVNAANREKDFRWLQDHSDGGARIQDCSDDYAQIAIQGPRAQDVLQQLTPLELASIGYYRFAYGEIEGCRSLISRTGYTGEDGFEIYVPPSGAAAIWRRLFEAGRPFDIAAAGLAARNTLRLEMRFALYGNDIDETTTPLEAGLGWIVRLDKGEFVGREALARQKEEGVSRRLAGFELIERGVARDHYPVLLNGNPVGEVSSGSFSPTLEKSIGLAYLPVEAARVDTEFEVDVRGRRTAARVVRTPFYRRN